MSASEENPPAFPRPYSKDEAREGLEYAEEGMSLRDYFAAKAMSAMLANPQTAPSCTDEKLCAWAYATADAMLEERKKRGGSEQ